MSEVLESLNLEPVINRLVESRSGPKWGRERAMEAAKAYKHFLFISQKYPSVSLVPNEDIDTVWHYHILDTQKYAADCDMLFGSFFHHDPNMDEVGEGEIAQADQTETLFMSEFGYSPYAPMKAECRGTQEHRAECRGTRKALCRGCSTLKRAAVSECRGVKAECRGVRAVAAECRGTKAECRGVRARAAECRGTRTQAAECRGTKAECRGVKAKAECRGYKAECRGVVSFLAAKQKADHAKAECRGVHAKAECRGIKAAA